MDSAKTCNSPQAGESRTESSDSVCPSVSGGGNQSIGGQITPDPRERRPLAKETDLPTTPRYLELTTEECTPKRYDGGRRELRDRPPRAPLTMESPSDMSDDTEEEEEEDYEETDVCTRSSSRSSGEELLEELDELVPMTSAEKRGARVAVAARKPSSLPQRDERGRFLPKKSAAPLPLPEAASKKSGKRAPEWTPPERSDRPPSKLTREGEMEETARLAAEARKSLGVEEAVLLQRPTAAALRKRVVEDAEIVATVAAKSGNLKGTFQGALKDAAASIKAAMGMLQDCDATLEVKKLQAENEALRAQLDHLRREMIDMRSELLQARARPSPTPPATAAAPPPPPPLNEAAILEAIEKRFEALERRICPPAAAVGAAAPQRTVEGPSAPPPTVEQGREAKRKSKKKGASRAVPVSDLPAVTPGGPQEAAPSAPPTWAQVAAGKVPKKTAPKKKRRQKQAKKKNKASAAKLHVPQTAAVVYTLQPEALEKGMTYSKVITEAKAKIDLGSLDIRALRFRVAATGARILELPGAGSEAKAEALAERMRQELGPGVRISTPTKGAELRITGLDDSSTAADVAAAIARATDCPEADIRVGEIRFAPRGRGAVWVRCPIAAAKTLAEKGQVTVGWVCARAVLLQPRPARCYRCLRPGHMAPQCTSEVDRSALCFRCSQPGHRAGQCTAAPHCGVCAEGKRPADHAVGSKACKPGPRPKKGPQGAG